MKSVKRTFTLKVDITYHPEIEDQAECMCVTPEADAELLAKEVKYMLGMDNVEILEVSETELA